MAVQLRRPGRRTPRAIRSSVGASTSTPCSDALSFVDRNINAFFDWIGHLHTPRSFIEGVFGKGSFGARFLIGVSDYVTGKINGAIDKIRELALDGVRLPIKFVTSAVAGVAATVSAVSKVANMLLPWQASVVGAPNPTRKGVGEGIPGVFVLGVSAPGSSLQWPPEIVDCAKTLANFTLPTTTPRGGVVTWDVSGQYPGGLIRPTGDSGPLNDQGRAQLDFVTTTETEEQAKGDPALGLVVAVAKVHRTDIDELVKLVTDTVFGALPEVIAKHFGPQLRALAKPLVDKIQAKAGTVMDVEDTSRLVVRYHKPPEPPKQRKNPTTGTWTGNWASQIYDGYSGTLVMQIVQDATSLDGTIKIAGSDCVANGNINGRVRDGKIHIGAVQAERSVSFDGQVRGGQMSGRFSAPACGGDSGVWSATKR